MIGVLRLYVNACINIKISLYNMDIFTNLFFYVGSYGPLILFILSTFFLWNYENLLFYYIIGLFGDSIINLVLKGLIQHPRPNEDINKFNLLVTHGKRFLFKDGIPYDIFGMPSGHAQSVLFSTVFIYLSLKNRDILYLYLFISSITILQRINYNYHTTTQVIVGSIIGSIFAYFIYYLARVKIKGRITEKKDDYGPI